MVWCEGPDRWFVHADSQPERPRCAAELSHLGGYQWPRLLLATGLHPTLLPEGAQPKRVSVYYLEYRSLTSSVSLRGISMEVAPGTYLLAIIYIVQTSSLCAILASTLAAPLSTRWMCDFDNYCVFALIIIVCANNWHKFTMYGHKKLAIAPRWASTDNNMISNIQHTVKTLTENIRASPHYVYESKETSDR